MTFFDILPFLIALAALELMAGIPPMDQLFPTRPLTTLYCAAMVILTGKGGKYTPGRAQVVGIFLVLLGGWTAWLGVPLLFVSIRMEDPRSVASAGVGLALLAFFLYLNQDLVFWG